MILCVLSDTHDNNEIAAKAASQIRAHSPSAVIHCGDVESPSTLESFADLPMNLTFGNCDWDIDGIRKKANRLGFNKVGHSIELNLCGKKIFAHHGDNSALLRHALGSGEFDYIFHGHTHTRGVSGEGKTKIVCPGALYRPRPHPQPYTFAVIDLLEDEVTFEEVTA